MLFLYRSCSSGARPDRRERIKHRGEFLVFDLDQRNCLLRRFFIDGGNGGHFIPDVSDGVLGENVFVVTRRRHSIHRVGNVLPGDDRQHAFEGFGLGSVNSLDSSVGDRRAEDFAVHHVGEMNVRGVDGATGDFVASVHSRNRHADGSECAGAGSVVRALLSASALLTVRRV